MTHMRAIPKPAYARMQRAKKRLKAAQLAANAVRVRERDGGRCRHCYSDRGLQVHHIRPRARGGKHDMDNLVLLCLACHMLIHAGSLAIYGDPETGLIWGRPEPKTVRRIA